MFIHEHVKEKSLLLVIDDIWHTYAFEKTGWTTWQQRIKIVITTCDKKVVEAMPNPYIYTITLLTKELSWKFVCIHSFLDLEEKTPPNKLTNIGSSIVHKCSRLPLAVKIVGGYMAPIRRLPND